MNLKKKTQCKCPFCETELENSCFEPVFCEPCKIKYRICAKCNTVYKATDKKCPKCAEGK
ncbi:MAG: hypothetical protein A2297_02300 [Elusimicrobia bacterium RIFOXYB2_FULL_48_7]|nr:MAG: hypothetical protein A2297_02300 [Elusimicrobia bacterium RIFOXYB2_FULL_48_7]